ATSLNVVLGFSVEYVLARERPIDIRPVIWPWARLLIHTQKPTSNSSGRIQIRASPRMLELGEWNVTLTPFDLKSARSASGIGFGPVVVKLLPPLNWPLILVVWSG